MKNEIDSDLMLPNDRKYPTVLYLELCDLKVSNQQEVAGLLL